METAWQQMAKAIDSYHFAATFKIVMHRKALFSANNFFALFGFRKTTRMWANAQRDGRPAEYTWRPLFNAAKFGWRWTTRVPCSNAAKTRKSLKLEGVTQTRQRISAVSSPKFTILWGHVEEVSMFNKFFPIVDKYLSCEDTARQSCAMVPK